jgi:ABC-type glycerol-3-phosphate transport system substrate-binding protein
MKNFNLIIMIIFIVGIVVATLIFSGVIKTKEKGNNVVAGASGKVILWGTLRKDAFFQQLEDFNKKNETFTVVYVQKNPETFNMELIEALASGIGPDMILVSQENIARYSDKIFPVAFTSFPAKNFTDSFITEASLMLSARGIMAFPLYVDPMVMYYNKSIFENAGFAKPPTTWDEVLATVPTLVQKDEKFVINQNAVALGEYDNVSHAKDILAMLMLQNGNSIVSAGGESLGSVMNTSSLSSRTPVEDALRFYTSFANPSNTNLYTWNKSFPDSRSQFVAGKLAMYLGYASELFGIQRQNPNLNFDIAPMPQIKDTKNPLTFGSLSGIAVLKSSKNLNTAIIASSLLSGSNFATPFISELSQNNISVVPARRDLLVAPPTSYYAPLFYRAGLLSRGWLDPKSEATNTLFDDMITNINSGFYAPDDAVNDVSKKLDILAKQIKY